MAWANNTKVSAILAAHLPGQESGNAIADVLWGDINPSGKLPYSIAKNPEDYDIPIINLTKPEVTSSTARQAEFTQGQMINYKHFDAAGIAPLFEFGFGLSYTRFTMKSQLKVERLASEFSSKPSLSSLEVILTSERL
ncbi:hypothetical protein QQX98_005689 [Neonectria punicea]|uniref:beta-glucosidase n=1 Tax=Neonectria punicea TaxID=979145 RepID=A0ABR1H3U9_9HYPO